MNTAGNRFSLAVNPPLNAEDQVCHSVKQSEHFEKSMREAQGGGVGSLKDAFVGGGIQPPQ